jgi:hypothetical protein
LRFTGSSSYIVVTTVRNVLGLEEYSWKDGRDEIGGSDERGVCRIDLVVGRMVCKSDGCGPVTVG